MKCFQVLGMISNFFQVNHQRCTKTLNMFQVKYVLIFPFCPSLLHFFLIRYHPPPPPFFSFSFFNTNINFICLFTFNSIITNQSLTLVPFPEGGKSLSLERDQWKWVLFFSSQFYPSLLHLFLIRDSL